MEHSLTLSVAMRYTSDDQRWSKSSSLTEIPSAAMIMRALTYEPAAIDTQDSVDSRRVVGICYGQTAGAGSFGDVYKGSCCSISSPYPPSVAVKVLRRDRTQQNSVFQQNLRSEVAVWQALDHPNVVPFYGASFDLDSPTLISLWMSNGSVLPYLAHNPMASRMKVVNEAAHGLEYLHSRNVVHGDLKAANILVSDVGTAYVGDFGISTLLPPETLFSSGDTTIPGTVRWMAPELLDGTQENLNGASDVYAFGITCWEIMTGNEPFYEYRADSAVLGAVMIENKRPSPKPDNLSLDIWVDMQNWWDRDPGRRPDMRSISKRLADSCGRKDSLVPPHDPEKENMEEPVATPLPN